MTRPRQRAVGPKALKGRTLLITSGPTREYLDAVRYLTNASSGKMGRALALAAREMGARVLVVSGPSETQMPRGVRVLPVVTAEEMYRRTLSHFIRADAVIGAAAVGDWRFTRRFTGKIKKTGRAMRISLAPNPDIMAELGRRRRAGCPVLVGFALETERWLSRAREKLTRKGLDLIVANRHTVIGSRVTRFALVAPDAPAVHFPEISKERAAREILRRVAALIEGKSHGTS